MCAVSVYVVHGQEAATLWQQFIMVVSLWLTCFAIVQLSLFGACANNICEFN
jgi:hypothetical protein